MSDSSSEPFETFIATELERLNYDALVDQVRIPVAVIADWYKRATGDRNVGTIGVSRRLSQMIGEGQLQRLSKDLGRRHGRCFLWTGEKADLFGEILNDLEARMDQEGHHRNGGRCG